MLMRPRNEQAERILNSDVLVSARRIRALLKVVEEELVNENVYVSKEVSGWSEPLEETFGVAVGRISVGYESMRDIKNHLQVINYLVTSRLLRDDNGLTFTLEAFHDALEEDS